MIESGVWWGHGWFWIVPPLMFGLCMYYMFFSKSGAMRGGPRSDEYRPPGGRKPGDESATDMAKRRYAAGEINQEEYQKIMGDLGV